MTSRERLRSVLKGTLPDRVPIDMGGSFCTGISAIAYSKLKKALKLPESKPLKMYDFIQQLAYPDFDIINYFGIDVIDAGQGFLKRIADWKKWQLNDNSKCFIPGYLNVEKSADGTVFLKSDEGLILGKKPKASLYVDQAYWVYKDLPALPETFYDDDIRKHLWALPIPPYHLNIFNKTGFEKFRNGISKLYNNAEHSIFLSIGLHNYYFKFYINDNEKL